MKIALFGSGPARVGKVYTPEILEELKRFGEVSPLIGKKNAPEHRAFLADCEVGFATWGMPAFTKDEIKKYLPKLRILFYSAGTVQYFARPFLECGVRIVSAYAANAVPVAEYTFAQITLAAKGYFQAAKKYRPLLPVSYIRANRYPGNYKIKIGLIGLGAIGSAVAQKLKALDAEVLACDPFASTEKAEKCGVRLVSMETLFSECDVISNHLANKKELNNYIDGRYFKLMKPHSAFINTGRGAQVNEYALAAHLWAHPSCTAIIDVLKCDWLPYVSPLFWCHNAVLTPHIAGSTGKEPQRMALYMINELENYLNGKPLQYEVTAEMLKTMA